jgi:hypothetical protein
MFSCLTGKRWIFLFIPYLLFNGLVWPSMGFLVKRFRLIDYVFVVYFGTREDIVEYVPLWFQRLCRSLVPLCISVAGIILPGKSGKRGLIVTLTRRPEEYTDDQFRRLLAKIQKIGAPLGALAGRIPSILAFLQIPVVYPFVTGVRGTIFAVTESLAYVLNKEGLSNGDVTIGVLGMGFIGGLVYRRLRTSLGYAGGVGVDLAFRRSYTRGGWIATNDPSALSQCDVIVVLTAQGSDIRSVLQYLKENVILIDDTHPEIPADIKNMIVEKGGKVYGVALQLIGVRFVPALPGFHARAIPGCVAEVIAVSGNEEIETQDEFDVRARALGVKPLLLTWNSIKR